MVWLYNRTPNRQTDISSMEMLTINKPDHRDFQLAHICVCTNYALNPKLQKDQKISKWNRISQLGQFLGFSNDNYSLVGNVHNLQTGYVYPQYHCVFKNFSEAVFSSKSETRTLDNIFDNIF